LEVLGAVTSTFWAVVEVGTVVAKFEELWLGGSINLFPENGLRFGEALLEFDVLP